MAIPTDNIFGVQIPAAHSIGDMIDGQLQSTTTQLQFPSDRPKYYTTLQFSNYTFRTGTGGEAPNVGTSWLLQQFQDLATSLQSSSNTNPTLGPEAQNWLQSLTNLLQAGQNRLNPVSSPQGSVVLPLPINLIDVHKVKYDEKPILPWVSIIGQVLGAGTDVFKIGGAMVGLAPNYYYTIIFDRPEYKRHELTFKLAPRNYQEAAAIRDIIMELNNHMSPDIAGPGGTAAVFTFPDIVQVTLRPNAGFLFKFKPAVIESIAINYGAGNRKAFYHDMAGPGSNPPESVEFTLHLLEIEYWLKNQFTASNE